jgi:hypothetical protein
MIHSDASERTHDTTHGTRHTAHGTRHTAHDTRTERNARVVGVTRTCGAGRSL